MREKEKYKIGHKNMNSMIPIALNRKDCEREREGRERERERERGEERGKGGDTCIRKVNAC